MSVFKSTTQEPSQQFLKRHLHEVPYRDEELVYEISTLPNMPTDSNPFWHDNTSSGVPVVNDLTMMYRQPNKDKAVDFMYLHNSTTGQRVAITAMSKYPRPKKIIYIGEEQIAKGTIASDMFHHLEVKHGPGGHTYCYKSVDHSPHYAQDFANSEEPVWYVLGSIGILVDKGAPAITLEHYEDYHAGDFTDTEAFLRAHQALERALGIS